MNKLVIIGALVRDPEQRVTPSGISVTTFSVACNRKHRQEGQPDADFFRVTAWRQLGENCAKYLSKGRKVCVVGPVSVSTYTGQDGKTRASMEVTAEDVEFLTPKDTSATAVGGPPSPKGNAQDAEERYRAEERDAIQNEGKYVDATPESEDDLPFD